jgi:hypothetical protein
MAATYELGWILDEDRRYEYQNVFAIEKTPRLERLVIAPSANQVSLMLDLLRVMPEPYGILYVLVVPRTKRKRDDIRPRISSREMRPRAF